MSGLIKDIDEKARQNAYFRQVLETGEHTQIVIMSIPAGGEIGMEVHQDNDQVLYLLEGKGIVILDGEESQFEKGDAVLVRAGTNHNFISAQDEDMKIITTYSPPHHPAGTIHQSKADAEKADY